MTIQIPGLLKLWKLLSDRGVDATEEIAELVDQDAKAFREGVMTKGVPMPENVTTPPADAQASAPAPQVDFAAHAASIEALLKAFADDLGKSIAAVNERVDALGAQIGTLSTSVDSATTEIGGIKSAVTGIVEKAQQAVETADAVQKEVEREKGRPLTPEMTSIVGGAKSPSVVEELFAGTSLKLP